LNIKAEEFVPNNSIEVICLEKDDNVTDVDNEVSLGNKPISEAELTLSSLKQSPHKVGHKPDLHLSFLSPYYPLSSWFLILDHFCCCPYLSIVLSYRYSGSFELYKVNPDKFQDVQDNEKSDRSELTTLKVESDSEKTGIVTCNKQDLMEIFEEMFKVKETGNHLYNAARQNQNRAPASNTNWNPIVSRKPVTCFSCNQPGHIARNCQSTDHSLMIIFLVIRIFHCLCINYRFLDSFVYSSRIFVQLNMDSSFIILKAIEKSLYQIFRMQGDADDFAFHELAAYKLP
jgi:hypothetical protein